MTVQRYDVLAARIQVAPARTPTTRIVCVDGPSGSGKTVFAQRLAATLPAPLVHLDDLYPGWDGLAAVVPKLVEEVLAPLQDGRPARYRRYDWERGEYAEEHDVPPTPALVVEGAGAGSRAVAIVATLVVWLEAPEDLRRTRGLERDGSAYRPHWERWARQEAVLFAQERTRDRADLLVDGAPTAPHDPEEEFVTLATPRVGSARKPDADAHTRRVPGRERPGQR